MDLDKENIANNDIDVRMSEAIKEEKNKLKEKRNRKKVRRRLIWVAIFLFLIVVIVVAVNGCTGNDVYSNEKEFAAFADKALKQQALIDPQGQQNTQYFFGTDFSYAVRSEECSHKNVEDFINSRVGKISTPEKKENNAAVMVDCAVRETGNGAVSLMISYSKYAEEDGEMHIVERKVETYLMKKNGTVLEPQQVLIENYRVAVAEYAEHYIENTYDRDMLNEGWEAYVLPDYSNFNRFLIDSNSITFFFDENTVVKEDAGFVAMSIGLVPIRSIMRDEIKDRYIDINRPMVAITFDDGPGKEAEEDILDTLLENGCVATFFYVGYRVRSGSDNAKRAVKIGCEIGNHSWDHPQLSLLSAKDIKKQIKKTNSVIKETCGVEPVVARPPYGDFDEEVLESSGMAEVLWTVDTLDWKTRDPNKIVESIKKVKKLDGKIILMHSLYNETAEATGIIIPWLKEQGYQMVTVSELIQYKTGKAPEPGNLYMKMP